MKVGQSILLLDGQIGKIKKIGNNRVSVHVSKNVISIRKSEVVKALKSSYDYFVKRSTIENSFRIPLKTLSYNCKNVDSYISNDLLEKAIRAFTIFSKLMANPHKLGIFIASEKAMELIIPFLKRGFKIKGYLEGGRRILILVRLNRKVKGYKLPNIELEASHD